LTAGTRRNGSSKFGSFKRVAARFGGSDGQAQDGRDVVEVFGHDEYGDIQNDETGAYSDDGFTMLIDGIVVINNDSTANGGANRV